jgi:hypothetical protein
MAMGSSLPPIISTIFMEDFEKLALDSAQYKPSPWSCMKITYLWSGLMAQIGYRVSSTTLIIYRVAHEMIQYLIY